MEFFERTLIRHRNVRPPGEAGLENKKNKERLGSWNRSRSHRETQPMWTGTLLLATMLALGRRCHLWHHCHRSPWRPILLSPLPAWSPHLSASSGSRPRQCPWLAKPRCAFTAKAAGKATPGLASIMGRSSASHQDAHTGNSHMEQGDVGAGQPLDITNLQHPHPAPDIHKHLVNSRLLLCF